MRASDPIVLTAYLLCVSYFLFRITDAFNDEYSIKLESDELKEQLEAQSLQDVIDISFKFNKRYEFDKLKALDISVKNKSDNYALYVDWDRSAVTDLDDRARRVARFTPGNALDMFQEQAFSAITPGTTLKEKITAESLLKRKGSDKPGDMEISEGGDTIVDLKKPGVTAPQASKDRFENFMRQRKPMKFKLYLAFRIVGPNTPTGGNPVTLCCPFTLTKLPWKAGLPWNPTK